VRSAASAVRAASSLRIVSELERSADLMVNVCKAARRLYDVEFDPRLRGLIYEMSAEAQMLNQKAIDAFTAASKNMALSEPVRSLATNTLPKLQQHLQAVKDAQRT